MYSQELHNAKLLEILDELLRVCKEHHLTYYLAYGTCLGAVRHKGIIPWDDDIDVLMPRRDLEKLYNMRHEVFGKDFKLASYRDDANHLYCMMKLESLTSTVIEHVNPIYVGGVYIDIFPLDNVMSEEEDAAWTQKVCTMNYKYDIYSVCPPPKTYWIKYLRYKFRRSKWLRTNPLQQWDNLIMQHKDELTNYVKDYHNSWPWRALFKSEVFGDGVEMEFEGRICIVPADYDTYLRISYGDYMQLPPKEKRVLKHSYLFEDSTRRWNKDELKSVVEKIQKDNDYHFSLLWEYSMIWGKIKRILHIAL